MRITPLIILIIGSLVGLTSCHDLPDNYSNDPRGNFRSLWSQIDQHYCFFNEKQIDWDGVYAQYAPRVSDQMTSVELFDLMTQMLDTLRDGHVNLSAPFNTSYYRHWWASRPQNFNLRLIQQNYFNFNYRQASGITYGILPQNIGYIHIPTFEYTIGDGNLDWILSYLADTQALIMDIRDNGGGQLTSVTTIVQRLIDRPTLTGYICHKTGPGHNDFSTPSPITTYPAQEGRQRWAKPICLLTNRSVYSAANQLTATLATLPRRDITIIGDTTGGGSGVPLTTELPNGWTLRMSACPMTDPHGISIENGVPPTKGHQIDMTLDDLLRGHDTILDHAIQLISTNYTQNQ